ncbi:NADH-quinone oxidoreductase subunit H [Acidilobus saccharovorans 345-15]|uniref:NADH-quinone oxidoreductase subunit H n=1 Tax=Acidilobus saccharovorans (strain DSM 16705 / JCM 18335 / VKM B-2471 / 345-15) TaxID=666510 RepID=D9Q0E8_ACIS3|nr:NADH-quinone oxidoreductase subunit NuoH [Acidilobus saccharovorans]ADL18786.1 NADH-quinone oxidoreductase subunit H [Acidilobus saccharovorans 345-15]
MITATRVLYDIGWGILHYIIFYPPVYQFVIIPGLVAALVVVIFIIWFERKAAARVQMRYGPLEISPRTGGAPQLIADLVRYMMQEIIVPSAVDFMSYILAPNMSMILSLLPMVAVPMTSIPSYWPIPMSYSLLIAVALSTLSPIFVVMMSWASNSKFSVLGGLRESFIVVAYELIAVISLLSVVPLLHTFDLVTIVDYQFSGRWLGLLNPLALLDAFIAVLMSTSGFPFEIPDSESELVAGPYTEYSGLLYGLNMGGAYIRRWAFSVLIALVFLGGWAPYRPEPGIVLGYLVPSLIVVVKAVIIMAIMSFLRAVYGRYRLDQALSLAWEVLIPIAIAAFGLSVFEAFIGVHP